MEIRTYDQVDPAAVTRLNLAALAFPFTPEPAAAIRRHDRRVQEDLCLYAVVDGVVAGQVGMFLQTVETLLGPMQFVPGRFAPCRAILGKASPEPSYRRPRSGLPSGEPAR